MARAVNTGKPIELPAMYDRLSWQQRQVVRNRYADMQGNACWFCGNDLDGDPRDHVLWAQINLRLFPPNFLKNPVHLQHDHESGLTEGAVHARCNAYLWQYLGR